VCRAFRRDVADVLHRLPRPLMVGGSVRHRVLNSVRTLSLSTRRWSDARALPAMREVGRRNAAVCRLRDGRLFVAGGRNGSGCLKTAEIFDPRACTWARVPNMRRPREGACAAAVSGRFVMVVGGQARPEAADSGGAVAGVRSDVPVVPHGQATETLASFEMYDLEEQTWLRGTAPMKSARFDFACGALGDGRVVVCGGNDGGGWLKKCELYDPYKNEWRDLPKMEHVRIGCRGCVLGKSTFVVTGGHSQRYNRSADQWQKDLILATCESIDLGKSGGGGGARPQWRRAGENAIPPMRHRRFQHCLSALAGGHLIAIGGDEADSVELYDATLRRWLDMPTANLPPHVYHGDAAACVRFLPSTLKRMDLAPANF